MTAVLAHPHLIQAIGRGFAAVAFVLLVYRPAAVAWAYALDLTDAIFALGDESEQVGGQ